MVARYPRSAPLTSVSVSLLPITLLPRLTAQWRVALLVLVTTLVWTAHYERWTLASWSVPTDYRGDSLEIFARIQAAAEGIGVAVGMRALADAEIAGGSLVCPFAFRRRSGRDFQIVARRGGANGRAVDLYRRWLTDEARRVSPA